MTVVSDDFNRSDEQLGSSANWNEDTGDWEVVSNAVQQVSAPGVYQAARWVGTSLAGDDHYVEADVDAGNSDEGFGVSDRNTAPTSEINCYTALAFQGDAFYLIDLDDSAENILGSWGTPAADTVYVMRVETEGTTIRMDVDGTERVSTTDASWSAGDPGMTAFSRDLAGYWDDWEAGDIAGGDTYYKSVAGALTFAGGLVKKTKKGLSGSITPTGSLVRKTSKGLSGALTFAGGVVKKTSKGLTGTLTFVGNLGTAATFRKALSGAMTFAGSLSTSLLMRQALSGAISFVGGLATQYTAGPGGGWIRWIDHRLLKWRKKFQ